ncbi:unnamed protein product [Lampetra planeri]
MKHQKGLKLRNCRACPAQLSTRRRANSVAMAEKKSKPAERRSGGHPVASRQNVASSSAKTNGGAYTEAQRSRLTEASL